MSNSGEYLKTNSGTIASTGLTTSFVGTRGTTDTMVLGGSNVFCQAKEVISVEVFDDRVEVAYRAKSNVVYAVYTPMPVPDTIWKEVIKFTDGRMQVVETIHGRHIPQSFNEEQFIWQT